MRAFVASRLVPSLAAVLMATVIACAPDASCSCDLTVTAVEVTQAIQTPANAIQLVAQRSTAVRAFVSITGATAPVVNVTGRLHVIVNGTEVTPSAGVAPLGLGFTAPLSPQRGNEGDTLNFELAAPTGITASSNVVFRVDLNPATGETNTANNSFSTPAFAVVPRTTPSLFYTAIDYTPAGASLPSASLIARGSGDLFVRGILPVNDGDPNLYRQGLFPSLTYGQDADGDGRLNALGTDGNNLISFLASCRQLIVNNGLGANSNTFLYGWLAGNPIDGNGLGEITGFNAFGNTDLTRGQRSYAHELTHNFGLDHNTRNLDEVGWDVGGRLIGNWSGNNVAGRLKPTTMFDIQAAGRLTNEAFVDTTTYNFLLASPILASREVLLAGLNPQAFLQIEPRAEVAVIQGIIDPTGSKLLQLKPVFRFPWASEPTNPEQRGAFIAEVVDEQGQTSQIQFDARVADDPDKREEEEGFGFFEVMVPVTPGVAIRSVRILVASVGQELGAFQLSEPPQLRVVNPSPGAQLGDRTEVAWELSDADTPLDQIFLQIAYSPDGGATWVPIAVDIPGTLKSVTFDSTQIQKSDGKGIIRVFAGDGLNTVSADVTELSATAAKYPAP